VAVKDPKGKIKLHEAIKLTATARPAARTFSVGINDQFVKDLADDMQHDSVRPGG
jgi:uncharacterized membrane protein